MGKTEVHSGDGLYNKYGMIDLIICKLNSVEVKGIENMRYLIESIQMLGALCEGLRKEDAHDVDNVTERKNI